VTEITTSGSWSLGNDYLTEGRQFPGCLDDFGVFNVGLPGSVIKNAYDAGVLGNNLLTIFPSAFALSDDDSDGDGICDQWELDTHGDVMVSDFTVGVDTDLDGLDDIDEFRIHGTNPALKDTDMDGIDDGDD
jgi:hypothetical protein